MNNTFYFLRHGETIRDKNSPAVLWPISEETKSELSKIAKQERFADLAAVYASTELKAKQSAQPFAEVTSLEVLTLEGLEEVHRGDKYLSDKEFKDLKRKKLEDRDCNPDGGETSNEALTRFKDAIAKIDKEHDDAKILVVSHGTILALYFSDLKNDLKNVFAYWNSIPFDAVGVVKNSEVIEDISSFNSLSS